MTLSDVPVLVEGRRGCGYRKAGGIYLRTDDPGRPCYRLPLPLSICPCCGAGIAHSRGWRWVDPASLFEKAPPCLESATGGCLSCPASERNLPTIGSAGLLWIGRQFYPSTDDFLREATEMGLSRRIHSVPRGFEVGKTWILLAHLDAVSAVCDDCRGTGFSKADPIERCPTCDGKRRVTSPGVFRLFRPTRVEYVCRGTETEEELDALVARGLTPVIVKEDRSSETDDDLEDRMDRLSIDSEIAESEADEDVERGEYDEAESGPKEDEG